MSDEWLFVANPRQTAHAGVVGVVDWDDFVSGITESFDNAADFLAKSIKLSKVVNQFTQFVQDIGVQTSAFIPQTRAIKIFARLVTGAKLIKILAGEDESGGAFNQIGVINLDDIDPKLQAKESRLIFEAIVRAANVQRSAMGLSIIEPVWLADPRV